MSAPMECRRIWVSIAFFTVLATSKGNEDTFSEELLIKPVNSGHVLMHFQFTTKSDVELLDKTSCKFCFNVCILSLSLMTNLIRIIEDINYI